MRLAELKRMTIKKQVRLRFAVGTGMECVVDEHGVARVPQLRALPDFNLDEVLAEVKSFQVETLGIEGAKVKTASAADVEKMVASVAVGAAAGAEHEE